MTDRKRCALTALQWTLGIVILIEAVLFLMPSARHEFGRTHMPNALREVLGWGEVIGTVLFLIPRTIVGGGWLLVIIFALAIVVHLLHGMWNVENLLIYAAAAWAVIENRRT
jgi:DoxX-like family